MISVQPSTRFRDAAGRFARFDGSDLIGAQLISLGDNTVEKLRGASPVRTGRLQAGWLSTYLPSQKAIKITDEAPYAVYLVTGTRNMPPNPNLRAVIDGLVDDARVSLQGIGADYIRSLVGGA